MLKLNQVINTQFKRLFLIPVVTLELALLLLYFLVNDLVIEESRQELLYERSQNVYEHLAIEAEGLNHQFSSVRQLTELLQRQHQDHFKQGLSSIPSSTQAAFGLASNGTYIKQINNGGSSLFVSQSHANNPLTQQKAEQTEYWDALLRYSVEQSPLVIAAYFNSYDNLNRYYPFIEQVETQFAPDLQLSDFNFYYLADSAHNPERQIRWTPAYLDPAGQGWLVSAIAPIYSGDFLEGVTGLDITLTTMVKEIERLMLPFSGEAFMVDEKGRILAMSAGTQHLLNLRQLQQQTYHQPVEQDLEEPDEFLLQQLPRSSFRKSISTMFEQGLQTGLVTQGKSTYLIASHQIAEPHWTLFSITSADEVLLRVNELEQVTLELGILAIIIMALFYTAFYFVVKHYSNRLSAQITTPLRKLRQGRPKDIPSGEFEHISDIEEIHQLQEYWQSQGQATASDFPHPEALITDDPNSSLPLNLPTKDREKDSLTQLLNRRGLLKEGEPLLADAIKLEHPLALLLFEIGEYSQIVESYGLSAADNLLKRCTECIQKTVSEQALLAHFSGSLFAVLLPNTSKQQSVLTARRLRSELYLAVELGSKLNISLQFAVVQAELNHYESLQQMLERGQALLEKCRGNRQNPIQLLGEKLE